MAETYTVVSNFMDVSFHPSESDDYGISMIFSETDFSFCIADLGRSKYIGFQHIARNEKDNLTTKSLDRFDEFFTEIFNHLPFLKRDFKTFRIAYMSDIQTLVPGPLYEPSGNSHYLDLMFGKQANCRILSDHVEVMDAHQVFAVPEQIISAVENQLEKRRIFSFGTVLIQSIWTNYHRTNAMRVFVNIRSGFLDLVVFNGKQVQFFNSFRQKCSEDILYYLIFVMEQLNLNPENVTVVLLGETVDDQHLRELCYTYIRHVEYGKRSSFFKYSPVLNELQPQAHYPLFNFLSCGL